MATYRLYFVNDLGQIMQAVAVRREDDADAIRWAEHQRGGGLIELWRGTRRVAFLPATAGS